MNESFCKAWLIVLSSGAISSAHCTCMAGLGECCSHTAAIAFALHCETSDEDSSCTDNLCTWNVPKSKRKIEPKKINDIDWGKRNKSYDGGFTTSFFKPKKI